MATGKISSFIELMGVITWGNPKCASRNRKAYILKYVK
jgi:hypothetical protein